MPLAVNGSDIDIGAQSDTDEAGLLQFAASRLTYQQDPDATARAEQRR